jgi:hypothetical protein
MGFSPFLTCGTAPVPQGRRAVVAAEVPISVVVNVYDNTITSTSNSSGQEVCYWRNKEKGVEDLRIQGFKDSRI